MNVYVKPGSKHDSILKLDKEFVHLSVQSYAKDGEANAAVISLVCRILLIK